MKRALFVFFDKTHPYRVVFWIAMVPAAFLLGWQSSIALLFLYSTYANIGADVGAWEAAEARKEDE